MKGSTVFLSALSIVTLGTLSYVYLSKDDNNAAVPNSIEAQRIQLERERLDIEKKKLEALQPKAPANTQQQSQGNALEQLAKPDNEETLRLKAELDQLKQQQRATQEENKLLAGKHMQITEAVQQRAEAVKSAVLIGKLAEIDEKNNFVVIELIGQQNLQAKQRLAVRRNSGLLNYLVLDVIESNSHVTATIHNGKFADKTIAMQIGDEVVINPFKEDAAEPGIEDGLKPAAEVIPGSPADKQIKSHPTSVPPLPKMPR